MTDTTLAHVSYDREYDLLKKMAAVVNEVPGVESWRGAGCSPGMQSIYVQRPSDPGGAYYGSGEHRRLEKNFQIMAGEVDAFGFDITDASRCSDGINNDQIAGGRFHIEGVDVTVAMMVEHQDVMVAVLEGLIRIAVIFSRWTPDNEQASIDEILALPMVDGYRY